MKPEIFVSYSRADQAQVFPIVEKLRDRGLNIWIDQEGIHGAKLWSQEIVNAIESSKIFILFASAKAFESKNVTKELALASESDKQILPVFLEDAEIPTAMKYQLAGIQHLVHEKNKLDPTIGNIIQTLGNLEIQSSKTLKKSQRTIKPIGVRHTSKTPLILASLVFAIIVITLLIFRGSRTQDIIAFNGNYDYYKSNIDLCVVTALQSNNEENLMNNRKLKDNLISKLTLFRDFKIIEGEDAKLDSTTKNYIDIGINAKSDFVLQSNYDYKSEAVESKIFDVETGRVFWAKTINNKDIGNNTDILEEASNIIAANIAGYDGCIYREILQNAIVKDSDDLTPIELLQIGKSVWENVDKQNLNKAIKSLNKCIELNPKISTAYAILADCYMSHIRMNYQIDNALKNVNENIQMAFKLDPKNSITISTKFWIDWINKDLINSENLVNDAIKANPNEPYALGTYGWFLIVKEIDVEKGKHYAEKALRYCEYPQGWYYWSLAEYHRLKKDYKEALRYKLKSDHRKHAGDYVYVASCNWLLNNKNVAFATYEDLLSEYPDFSINSYRNNRHIFDGKVIQEFENAFDELIFEYNKKK